MLKTTVLALVAATAFAGAAAPAFADYTAFNDTDSIEMRDFQADAIVAELNQRGVNASSVEDWSGLIRAYVTLEDGTQTMQFFVPGSLEQVSL
ncbi:hypothetical protein SAMN05428969_0024 [Devosia sp. YR412]|uniref:hypothetical protein n=1 Tax=Devosia sp. YR412 TaxID=1881030 RepID=UPI0008D4F802|nr:hypothetical protein [Devosia sp. YR412]SEP59275.1 hypothetical protein SAMN05428969_0024 [Devosia sp. YR412]